VTNRAPGETCSSASQCGSGFCADGVCCNAACNGQCEACDQPFAQGVCSPVAGDPHGSRRACDGEGPCGATCDGTSTEACVFADATTTCGPASCSGDKAQAASICDGAGTCKPAEAKECGAYACTDGACAASCTTDDQCAYRHACQAGACHPIEIYQVPTTIECSWSVAGDAAAGPSPWLVGFSALLFARRRRRRN
jgi:MYXO-CTERM domain-containing protein